LLLLNARVPCGQSRMNRNSRGYTHVRSLLGGKPGTVDRRNSRCDISLCLLQDAVWSQAFASVVVRNYAVASPHLDDMVASADACQLD
jgi:hypothetical protein